MFTVTITEKTIKERPAGKDWELTGLDDPKFAYTPAIVKKKEVELKIYEQTVEVVDIKKVIQAVNENLLTGRDYDEDTLVNTAWFCPEPNCGFGMVHKRPEDSEMLCPWCKKHKFSEFEIK